MIRAIYTAVYAVIRQVQRGKENYAVSIELLLYFQGKGIDFLFQFRIVTIHEDCSLTVSEALALCRLFQYLEDAVVVLALTGGFFKRLQDLGMVYKLLRMRGTWIIHGIVWF